jgi:hypothetical protein
MLSRNDFTNLHFGGVMVTNLPFQTVAIYKIKKRKTKKKNLG